MGLPFALGAVQFTVAAVSVAMAPTPVGAPGTPKGVTPVEGADGGPTPTPLLAVTVKV